MNPVFRKLHHICIVVHDIDKSKVCHESIGIGPWVDYPPLSEYTDLDVPNPEAFSQMKYRVCNPPNTQLQLCQPPEAAAKIPVMMSGRRRNRTGFTSVDRLDGAGVVLSIRATGKPGR
ncbi:hypothetical protein QO034_15430 [Sedimentitalea sp. JM2-8]|uniref:Glyoxalase/Bleomycin resistance protein/Dioxygenase superfamily protein n=1 Tax=Sedimentitalea xiamensis TaxID=3050037 RepID=A0ABT7FHG8_9RHOB|nr:hypothetical protein [Sedimentitalea xiamensis]MDK3074490.1 hypothetical protein [Sedimentitalea xiamensis]